MAQPNYGFAKRQRELAKKQKKEEKRLRKLAEQEPQPADGAPGQQDVETVKGVPPQT
ncbi:MAG: hypothetical protein Q8L65_11455 [Burkholderiales bacterium]|jgi:hypothetical protein|nr:hypothetical protein [Burkholderiales bacterium]MDP2398775.1 hypothetical protein [Burkholderiales bacterium]